MSNKSGTSSQAITLPSGGGALQGIGETFSPDLFTGTGNFTVSIELPPGRNGFQPRFALVYSTGNGNGLFGLGWDLSIPGVSRKTSKGIPRYRDNAIDPKEWDTFILSGAEDLVPVSEPAPGVTHFQPRTQGLFARIERVQTAGEDFWRVRSKDGLVSLYGTSVPGGGDPAVVADPAARSNTFCWKLSQTTDPFGNRIDYQYLRDSGAEGPHVWDQLYLQKVEYVDYEKNGQTRFLVSVTFVYEERPDPFSDYRGGFEIRTRLRCKRIEIRTHADQDRLARTYELVYLDERVRAGELPSASLPLNGVSLLSQIRVAGHDGDLTEKLPPLEFGYTRFAPEQQRFQSMKAVNDALPPRSLENDDFEMVSLFGNGLPDIVQMNGAVQFWRNLGNGLFDSPRTMNEIPAGVHLRDPGVQFADMNGDGRADLLVLQQRGYFPLSFQGQWSAQGFVQYASSPSVNFGDNNFRLVDLDGDGVIDGLRTGGSFELFLNDPVKGWETVETRPRQPLEVFPNLSLSDPRVKLADLTGDDLQDFVLVEQGRIDYWPYLGHGQWGRRITMKNSPVFRDIIPVPGGFDPKRVLLGDLDGDGLDDIIYVEPHRLTLWINQGGEGWSEPTVITNTPPLTDIDAVRLADMLGTGMAGVLWSFDRTAGEGSNFQFLKLTGDLKPYLLEQMDNHMGAVTRVQYASSTKFYLADSEKPETRWKMPLPFPVQVVACVEVIDDLSGGKLTTEYRYHHGYWDGTEREFRGFGRVEQLDTEFFDDFNRPGLHGPTTRFESVNARTFSPPLLTKTWFHPGPVGDEFTGRSEADFSGEYWPGDPSVLPRPADTLELLRSLPASHRADAIRSLRAQVMRTELYALDASEREDRPFTVTESQYGIREESAPTGGEGQRRRIFFPHPIAQRMTQWERGDEPMTQFSFTRYTDDAGNFDPFGRPLAQTQIACPRDWRSLDSTPSEPYLATLTRTVYAEPTDPKVYIHDRVAKTTIYEFLNTLGRRLFELENFPETSGDLKVTAQTINFYDGEEFVGLPFGKLGDFGALVRTESLILTEEILREAYRDPTNLNAPDLPPYLRPQGATSWPAEYPKELQDRTPKLGGYVFADGSDHRARGYFAHGSRTEFDFYRPDLPHCGLPLTTRDPLGNDTTIDYDRPFHLLPVRVTDAVGLTISAANDYRVLQPRIVTDVNRNRRAVSFSPLGLVTATAVMGKEGESVGDTLEVPGSRLEYDFFAFDKSPPDKRQPIFVRSIVREHHLTETDVLLPERDATIETVEYSDGFGRLLQTRTQAEDVLFGDLNFGGGVLSADQSVATGDVVGRGRAQSAEPNVIVSGWQIYDNKGRVVEKYEPFFDTGYEYDPPSDAQLGQKARMFYDARGQVIRTLNPDGSEQLVIYGIPVDLNDPDSCLPTPWEAYTYDANDLAPVSKAPDGTSLANAAPVTHHFTPSSIVIDVLGRTIEAIARNGSNSSDWFRTRSTYDIRGNVLTVTDALEREAFRYIYDLANRPWRIESIDAGLRRMILDVIGNEIERRDSKGALILPAYDLLQRPIRVWARDDAASPVTLRQRMEYGDAGKPDQNSSDREAMRARNLLGQLIRHHDEAGLTTVTTVDFKGNVLDKSRRVIADAPILAVFDQAPTNAWRVTPFQIDWEPSPQQTLAERENELLETTAYQTTSSVDALNRVKRMQFPEDVEGKRRELRPVYNNAGGLEKVFLEDELYVDRIAYDAKGQRALIAYGNGVMTRYAYNPHTFRLTRLRSERYSKPDDLTYRPGGEALQDFGYDYDLAGNILGIRDRTPESGILNNPEALSMGDPLLAQLLVSGNALNRRFDYDPIYRLLSATGRECDRPPEGDPWHDQPRCTDLTKARAYSEQYRYDAMGNMLRLEHRNDAGGFTREFAIETANNRLRRMEIGDVGYDYAFDANGNMRSETTSRHFEWNHGDQMRAFRTQTQGAEPSVHAHYLYDAAGQRVKKLVRKQGGQIEVTHYIDEVFEHHRWGDGAQAGENNHVHVMDDKQRIAVVRFGPAHPDDQGPAEQFHLGDHLGSSNVVVDLDGEPVNREEFTPYGETSFGSFAKKRFRFTGKERDEENGLNYHEARYLWCWTGRFGSVDPHYDRYPQWSPYCYALANPARLIDPTGQDAVEDVKANISNIQGIRRTAETAATNLKAAEQAVADAKYAFEAMPLETQQQFLSGPLTPRDLAHLSNQGPEMAEAVETAVRLGEVQNARDDAVRGARTALAELKGAEKHYLNKKAANILDKANVAQDAEVRALLANEKVMVKNTIDDMSQSARDLANVKPGGYTAVKAGRSGGGGGSSGNRRSGPVQRWQPFRSTARLFGNIAGSALNWAQVLTASDEGSAGFGILMVYGCRLGPKVCAAAGLIALVPFAAKGYEPELDLRQSLPRGDSARYYLSLPPGVQ